VKALPPRSASLWWRYKYLQEHPPHTLRSYFKGAHSVLVIEDLFTDVAVTSVAFCPCEYWTANDNEITKTTNEMRLRRWSGISAGVPHPSVPGRPRLWTASTGCIHQDYRVSRVSIFCIARTATSLAQQQPPLNSFKQKLKTHLFGKRQWRLWCKKVLIKYLQVCHFWRFLQPS